MHENIDTFEKLEPKLSYFSDKEKSEIKAVYEFASEHHFGQKRKSGEDYIIHPLNVAAILTGIYADAPTICAALLHDTIEDCGVTSSELEENFGSEVTKLVNGVTKINKLNYNGDNEATIANHRKILVGLSEDVRVIILKLADRLHNMRTLWALSEKRQKANAKETLDILVPIAHRLGINSIKSELEDLSLRYYKPDVYFSISEQLNKSKAERDNIVKEMQEKVSKLLIDHGIKHEIKGRAKSIYSIYNKLDKGKKFSDIYDLLALRVFVDTEQDCYQALGIIHSKYRPIPKRFKDYIAMPKTNMYQSLHTTVFGIDGYLFEIQIRTYEMDKVAELGIASHWSYKEHSDAKKQMQNAMEQKLQFFRTIMELKKEENSDEEFVRQVTEDVFKDTIYVFTPKGDVIELPMGSTPIDFAYRVHSDVGDKMVGAIVNNSIVPFDYELKDNDIIKINTNKNSTGPNKEWINMAKTTQAKNKIKSFFNKMDKEEYLKKGEEALKEELRKRKIAFSEFLTDDNISIILSDIKINNLEEMYKNIGSNKLSAKEIVNIIYNENKTKEDIIIDKTSNNEVDLPQVKTDIIVSGIDEVKINIASCCKPVPGDDIVGYITKGYGITIHQAICPNIINLEERLIDVRWNSVVEKKYPTNVLIHAESNKSVLLDVISKTSNTDVTVVSINTLSSTDEFLFDLTVSVPNIDALKKFMDDVRLIKEVTDVERIIK